METLIDSGLKVALFFVALLVLGWMFSNAD